MHLQYYACFSIYSADDLQLPERHINEMKNTKYCCNQSSYILVPGTAVQSLGALDVFHVSLSLIHI